jgi:vacuolar-type H+-ATPase subunit E/Vma4
VSQQSSSSNISSREIERIKEELRQEMKEELRREMREELRRDRAGLEEKLDSVQRTQDMILEMLRQEPA